MRTSRSWSGGLLVLGGLGVVLGVSPVIAAGALALLAVGGGSRTYSVGLGLF